MSISMLIIKYNKNSQLNNDSRDILRVKIHKSQILKSDL